MGRKDRCTKGKSCGVACINRLKECLIDLNLDIKSSLGRLKNRLLEKVVGKLEKLEKRLNEGQTPEGRLKILSRKFDSSFGKIFNRKSEVIGGKFDWKAHLENSELGGRGAFGMVMLGGNVAVKRGEIGKNEALNMQQAGEKGIGPKMIRAELGRKIGKSDIFDDLYRGRIAMERAKGTAMEDFLSPREKVGNTTVGDSYWALRKRLHKELGMAHNDLHEGNVFVNPKTGKAMAIDFGLSQKNVFAALAEALGPFAVINEGDFQAKRPEVGYSNKLSDNPRNFQIMSSNLGKVKNFLIGKGLESDDVEGLIEVGIRQSPGSLKRGVGKLISEEDAAKAIDLLYEGVT